MNNGRSEEVNLADIVYDKIINLILLQFECIGRKNYNGTGLSFYNCKCPFCKNTLSENILNKGNISIEERLKHYTERHIVSIEELKRLAVQYF